MLSAFALGTLAVGQVPTFDPLTVLISGVSEVVLVASARITAPVLIEGSSEVSFGVYSKISGIASISGRVSAQFYARSFINYPSPIAGIAAVEINAVSSLTIRDYWVDTVVDRGDWAPSSIEDLLWVNTSPPKWNN